MLRQRPFSTPSRAVAAQDRYAVLNRKLVQAFAQQVVAAHSASTSVCDEGGKPAVPGQVSRLTLPCDKPLPLANVMEVQRLLFLLEAPEYCMRAFREHCVNGQDLVHMQESDFEDSRFKFPRHVKRKVLRIAEAWRFFQVLNEGPTQTSLSMERFLDHHLRNGSPPEVISELRAAFLILDINNNGSLTFEEFLLGFSLLEAAGAAQTFAPTSASTSSISSTDPRVSPADVALSARAPPAGVDRLAALPFDVLSVTAAATPASTAATVAAVGTTTPALPDPAPPSEVAAGASNESFVRGFAS
ncbi:hypothetical protein Vretimale_1750 [Volvox reticuliferus]|uniref:EF-hand domain-containing protein n=1 Tax=Volvox reticuliferus TaxID=1737510 RepID=A0A8J4CUW8_9CHLO|nr:hypothetical protein Vretifemale_15363 [Volvox reticuliferus]GIL95808.1 hypothetical protein Vretimale_1750 [Volvox reticuliferus]